MSKSVKGYVWRAYAWPGRPVQLERLSGAVSAATVLVDRPADGGPYIRRGRRGVDVFDTAEDALRAFIRVTQSEAERLERELATKREHSRQAEEKFRVLGDSDGGGK